jgi:hypothetical protein
MKTPLYLAAALQLSACSEIVPLQRGRLDFDIQNLKKGDAVRLNYDSSTPVQLSVESISSTTLQDPPQVVSTMLARADDGSQLILARVGEQSAGIITHSEHERPAFIQASGARFTSQVMRDGAERNDAVIPRALRTTATQAIEPPVAELGLPSGSPNIRILFVYTPWAKVMEMVNDPTNPNDDLTEDQARQSLTAKAAAKIAYMNLALQNSGVDAVVSFSRNLELAGYIDTSISELLYSLTNPSDGKADAIFSWAKRDRADLIHAVSGQVSGFTSGMAWLVNLAYSPFSAILPYALTHSISVTQRDAIVSFAHEIGHQLGLDHNRESAACNQFGSSCDPMSYAFGFLKNFSGYSHGDIMAYATIREARFSDPDHWVQSSNGTTFALGVPIGQAQAAHGSQYLREAVGNASLISNYR